MFRRRTRVSRADVGRRLDTNPIFQELTPEEQERVRFLVERMAGPLLRQGEKAVFWLSRIDDTWISQVLAERADMLTLQSLSKESVEMSNKLRERERKSASGVWELFENTETPQGGGLAGALRPLMKKAEGAVEAAIAATERRRAQNAAHNAAPLAPVEGTNQESGE